MKKLALATVIALMTTYTASAQLKNPQIEPEDKSYLESIELENFVLTFADDVQITSFNEWALPGLTLNIMQNDGYGEYVGPVVATYDVMLDSDKPNEARLACNKFVLTEIGRYVLQIPPFLFVTNQGVNENMEFYYEVVEVSENGVSAIPTDRADNIWTLTGIKVDADKSALPSGLYIINGRKVIK